MQHLSSGQVAGILGIAVVVAVAAGLALSVIGSRLAARRTRTPRPAERWRRR